MQNKKPMPDLRGMREKRKDTQEIKEMRKILRKIRWEKIRLVLAIITLAVAPIQVGCSLWVIFNILF